MKVRLLMVPVECGFERRPVWVRVAPVLKVEGGSLWWRVSISLRGACSPLGR